MMKFSQILETDNLAELEDLDVSTVSNSVMDGYRHDEESRQEQLQIWEQVNTLLEVSFKTKDYPFPGASNVKVPALANACITFAARAYSAIIKDGSVVKAKTIGSDKGKFEPVMPVAEMSLMAARGVAPPPGKMLETPGSKQRRADRVAEYMNWQLLYKMEDWEEGFDDLLHKLPAYGSMFKKIYYSEADGLKHSDLIFPQFLCVNINAETIGKAARVTHLYDLERHEIIQKINEGVFIEFDLQDAEHRQKPYRFIEQHTRIDLDGDGYPEPYIVTMCEETEQIVAIYKRFAEDEVVYQDDNEKDISYITATQYFVHFKFLPDPIGGFYGNSYGNLILGINSTANTLTNQIIDSGSMSLQGGGFIGKGLRMKGGQMRIPMGRYTMVNASGRDLKDNLVPLNFPPPSGTSLQLLEAMFQLMKDTTGMKDVLEGQIRSDQSATATLAQADASLNEFKSIFKRIYRALQREFEHLMKLNADYPDAEEYQKVLDMDKEEVDIEKDIGMGSYDIVPVADASELTNIQRQMKAESVLQLVAQQLVAPKPAVRDYLKAINVANYEEYLEFEPPSTQEMQMQQQLLALEQEKQQAVMLKEQNRTANIEIDATLAAAEVHYKTASTIDKIAQAEERESGKNLRSYIDEFKNLASNMERSYATSDNTRDLPRVAEPPRDEGIIQTSQ